MDKVKISEAEMELLQLLWDRSPLTAAQLVELAPEKRKWQPATVKTLLARLVAKGAIRADVDGRRFLYSPAIERDALAVEQAGRLVDRMFGGRVSPLVAQLAEQRDLSADDLDELEALIRNLRS
ncbi:MAG: BlaI/MecI/CopY family transcriptional regulator [Pseudomonadota bacterium]|nr:BlaI/MecI/CopY family transcriptional regulator [Pseudomonadota bacterium]